MDLLGRPELPRAARHKRFHEAEAPCGGTPEPRAHDEVGYPVRLVGRIAREHLVAAVTGEHPLTAALARSATMNSARPHTAAAGLPGRQTSGGEGPSDAPGRQR